jgi:hypothetical protein
MTQVPSTSVSCVRGRRVRCARVGCVVKAHAHQLAAHACQLLPVRGLRGAGLYKSQVLFHAHEDAVTPPAARQQPHTAKHTNRLFLYFESLARARV